MRISDWSSDVCSSDLYSPTNPLCVVPGVGPATITAANGASCPDILAALTALDGLSDLGSTNDVYRQDGENWALFTHNISHITDKLYFTFGIRYTNDKKKFSASFTNATKVCTPIPGPVLDVASHKL